MTASNSARLAYAAAECRSEAKLLVTSLVRPPIRVSVAVGGRSAETRATMSPFSSRTGAVPLTQAPNSSTASTLRSGWPPA